MNYNHPTKLFLSLNLLPSPRVRDSAISLGFSVSGQPAILKELEAWAGWQAASPH